MKIIKGNLISLAKRGDFDLIAHGNNCQNIWGAGIAAQIKEQFPDVFLIDKEYNGEFVNKVEMMGTFSRFWYSNGEEQSITFWIVNMYTQLFPGLPSPGCKIPFDYEAFTLCCRKINQIYRGKKIGLPWIGCGLGGAFQPMVATIINDNLNEMEVTIVEYENNKISLGRMAATGLGDATPDRKIFDSGREKERGRYPMGADNEGRGDYKRGAPIKMSNHHHPTEEIDGRSYNIGLHQPKDEYGFDKDDGNAKLGVFSL